MTEQPRYSKPEGDGAFELFRQMNDHHGTLSAWGLSFLCKNGSERILDIGCGGGMFISLLAEKYGQASISGVDHSEKAVEYARSYNRDLVDSGRCSVSKGSVSDLPFRDGWFDIVTAVETYYYWPDLRHDFGEINRVMKKGGTLLILAESYPHPDFDERNREYERLYDMNIVPNDEMAGMLGDCGFDVAVHTKEESNWVAFVAEKAR